jgi:hypothetical protein
MGGWGAGTWVGADEGADVAAGMSGVVGHHTLADIQDSPGAICTFALPGPGSLGETLLRVNAPVVYAADTTAGEDRQPVGWRARIDAYDDAAGGGAGGWRRVQTGPLVRDEASDRVATYFDGDGHLAAFLAVDVAYAAAIDLFWFDPADPDRVTGRAELTVERYALLVRDRAGTRQAGVAGSCRLPR